MKVYKVAEIVNYMEKEYWVSAKTYRRSYECISDNPKDKSILIYKLNKTTKPNFGFIYCFSSLKDAMRFNMDGCLNSNTILLEGRGIRAPKDVPIVLPSYFTDSWETMKKGWTLLEKGLGGSKPPNGTILMKTFTPLKVIDKNRWAWRLMR